MNTPLQPTWSPASADTPALLVQLQPVLRLTDDQFYEFCRINKELRIERTAWGGLLIMPPTGGYSSERNAEVTFQLRLWAKQDGTGATFDSSGGFVLPNGAVRSPDASWVGHARLASLTDEQRMKFLPLCPDFVIELRSLTDSLSVLQEKMREYVDNGARLGWLIDPPGRRVFVHRPGKPVERFDEPESMSADPVLSGFRLEMGDVW